MTPLVEGRTVTHNPTIMNGATVALVGVTIAIAVFAGPLYELCERAAEGLLDPTAYVNAVLGR
jgi:multicomponent Na+:H+ antiporter subunit D